ncbi:unnamed protein product [Moneuplotes crassus]|uniref:Uncharacterized protein n=1 Tax=Euplotes crassus TaxID=5936 RepID=A0AAD2D4P6_EUPCR|nr:unnamed protein product [Moneuplotes crassus]
MDSSELEDIDPLSGFGSYAADYKPKDKDTLFCFQRHQDFYLKGQFILISFENDVEQLARIQGLEVEKLEDEVKPVGIRVQMWIQYSDLDDSLLSLPHWTEGYLHYQCCSLNNEITVPFNTVFRKCIVLPICEEEISLYDQKSIFFIRQGYHSNKYVCVDLPNCRLDEYYQEYREELKEISKTSFWNVLFPYQIESTDQSYD